ncbi:hypothetical protein D3C81_2268840 [compost metagenome]
MRRGQQIMADKLARDLQQLIVHNDDMIAIPAHRTADVQQNAARKQSERRQLVRDDLCRMEMPGIEAD